MTKADIARIVYERHGGISNREAARLVEIIFENIKSRLGDGEKVQITGFGTFLVREKREAVDSTSSTPVTDSVILVCTLHFRGCRSSRCSSRITGNPIPPMITAAAIGRQIHGSVTNPIRLSEYSANPALLNADTEWKTPRYTARGRGSS